MHPTRSYAPPDVVPTLHSADCDSRKADLNTASAGIAIDRALPDEIASYVIGARPVYSDLRRLLGQIAGLLILAQASNRKEALDLPMLAAAKELWLSVPERMEGLRAPSRLDAHLYHLKSAHRLLGSCFDSLAAFRCKDEKLNLTDALADIARAYAHLQSASEPRAGMTMVDFRQACCHSGQAQEPKP
jgi:hypothetical protein